MDIEKKLYEVLKHHKANPTVSKPDLFKMPEIGVIRETKFGQLWMVETVYDEGYLHGRTELSKSFFDCAYPFIAPDENIKKLDITKAAVIDTETTGLAGGTGTYPFILGVGLWSDDKFIVRQYILRDFCEEPAQLAALTEDLKNCSNLLTYNGKSFDMPLIKTRYRINRMKIPYGRYPHIDLLHPCRRIFKEHFESFKLSELEESVLGFARVDDVPSHLIPQIYFDFLQTQDEKLLHPILYHNRDDIISLYVLAQEISRLIDLVLSHATNDDKLYLAIGKILFNSKQYDDAIEILNQVKAKFSDQQTAEQTLLFKAYTAKKNKDWKSSTELWQEMIDSNLYGIYPYIELAKHLEHRKKKFDDALNLTNSAISVNDFERQLTTSKNYKINLSDLKRRQKRLIRKINAKK